MKFEDAVNKCHVRSSIYRTSKPNVKYPKNHSKLFIERVPLKDTFADDWEEYDPREHENYHDPA